MEIRTTKAAQLTYGLFYPAFFGNMIYDIVQALIDPTARVSGTHPGFLQGVELWIGLLLIIYFAIDYIHLYVDMKAADMTESKTPLYIICDILSSLLFFLAFVALKYHHANVSAVLVGLVPLVITFYKWELLKNGSELIVIVIFGVISTFSTIPYFIQSEKDYSYYYFCNLLSCVLFYTIYVFFLRAFLNKKANSVTS
ncbi:hypothetical protein [Mucilaginibacter segetis]|uniref:Uncharacterized protein n=1 Tax=Mucilaginibacter segetis TaxID=2793071 RepID=A0A934UMX7_9SPHI|nr:hypothetical protein [Mucilaginibacter segetis]MBK0379326.1 hypothetical protein [Mucilaginibacter segetis]